MYLHQEKIGEKAGESDQRLTDPLNPFNMLDYNTIYTEGITFNMRA